MTDTPDRSEPTARDYFLCIDKPAGITSRDAVDQVARLVGTKRVGHAGTLDPQATGVLVIAVGKATRLVEYVQMQTKIYEAEFLLGKTSDTDDAEGNVEEHETSMPPTLEQVEQALASQVGVIDQTPPVFSAIKMQGRRAYKLARAGRSVEMKPRKVSIESVELSRYEFPTLQLRIKCGSGVYIRSIARDVGKILGTGGLMSRLRRTGIGNFTVENAVPLDQLTEASLQESKHPLSAAVTMLASFTLDADQLRRFQMGQPVPVGQGHKKEGELAVLDGRGDFAGIGLLEPDADTLRPIKGGFLPS